MAITWKLEITPINTATYEASIEATRTDSEDPDNPTTYTVARAPLETPAQQLAVLDEIWAKHLAALSATAAVEAFVTALESAGKTTLEARE